MAKPLRIAVEGCGHGTLNAIYDSITRTCAINKWPGVDLLIIGGDFQAVRNMQDLNIMSCPEKYRELGDFHEYYSGARRAPYLTLFVGGNHEASSHLWELYYGGWAAPNIYYMGAAAVLNFRGLRIGGVSGIYNPHHYRLPHNERLPYSPRDVKSAYHVRAYDVFKLYQVQEPVDVMVSHDWPQGIEHWGDLEGLLRRKPFFRADIEKGELGSPPSRSLLHKLRPRYWFSAHMHVKFAAVVDHEAAAAGEEAAGMGRGAGAGAGAGVRNPEELDIGLEEEQVPPVVKNPDELEIDLEGGGEAEAAPARNPDELDLDLDEEEGGVSVPLKDSDEIELDLDEQPENLPPAAAAAAVASTSTSANTNTYTDEIDLDSDSDSDSDEAPTPAPETTTPTPAPAPPNRYTHFLALDKCLPKREFLQILNITPTPTLTAPPASATGLSYDPEWLAITRALNPYLHDPDTHRHAALQDGAAIATEIARQRVWVQENIVEAGRLGVEENFVSVAPVQELVERGRWGEGPQAYGSVVTEKFCALLGIEDGTKVGGDGGVVGIEVVEVVVGVGVGIEAVVVVEVVEVVVVVVDGGVEIGVGVEVEVEVEDIEVVEEEAAGEEAVEEGAGEGEGERVVILPG